MPPRLYHHPLDGIDNLRPALADFDASVKELAGVVVTSDERIPRGRLLVVLEGGTSALED